MKYIRDFFYGVFIGFANAIPGVSGGTIAVILNIYDKIMYAVSRKNFRKYISFLLLLGLGMLVGIFLCAKIVVVVMKSHEIVLNFCFMGLIVGSVPAIYKRANADEFGLRTGNIVLFFLAFISMILFSFYGHFTGKTVGNSLAGFGGLDLGLCLWLFICCIIATIAMLLPGISGSLVLLMLGVYTVVIESINSVGDILTTGIQANSPLVLMIPVAAGTLLGLFVGIKMIKLALRYHARALYFIILGLVAGSIFPIIEKSDFNALSTDFNMIFSIAGLVVMGLITFFLSYKRR